MIPAYLGVDPGVEGALALFRPSLTPASGLRWQVIDVPIIGEAKKKEIDAQSLRDWLRKHEPTHAFLELVSAMPSIPGKDGHRRGMGSVSAFRFGGMFFALKAILACCDVPVTMVTPQSWKAFHGLKGSSKENDRLRAIQLFPDQHGTLKLKKSHNRSEAMLIAAYGAHKLGGVTPERVCAEAGLLASNAVR